MQTSKNAAYNDLEMAEGHVQTNCGTGWKTACSFNGKQTNNKKTNVLHVYVQVFFTTVITGTSDHLPELQNSVTPTNLTSCVVGFIFTFVSNIMNCSHIYGTFFVRTNLQLLQQSKL